MWTTDSVRPILEAYCQSRGIDIPKAWWWTSQGEGILITANVGIKIEANKDGAIMSEEKRDEP